MYYNMQSDRICDDELAMEGLTSREARKKSEVEGSFDGKKIKIISKLDSKLTDKIVRTVEKEYKVDKKNFYSEVIDNQTWNPNNEENLSSSVIDTKCPIYLIEITMYSDKISVDIWRRWNNDIYGGHSLNSSYELNKDMSVSKKNLLMIEG